MERNALNGAKTGDACGYPLTNHAERKGIGNSRGLWRAFWVAALALGLYLVPSPALCSTATGAKGIYAYGYSHFFSYFTDLEYGRTSFSDLGSSDVKHRFVIDPLNPAKGSLGACAFNGKLYCFFMTDSVLGLQYVTVTPSDTAEYQYEGPFGVATAMNLKTDGVFGVAAAVMDGTLYVFTPARTFSSKDGVYFRSAFAGPEWSPVEILDAVTFYPPKHDADDPGDPGIMVVYDRANPKSAIFRPALNTSWSNRQDLPEPSDDILNGNLVLGTAYCNADDPCYSLVNSENPTPAIQFYAALDGYRPARCQYDLKEKKWYACNTVWRDREKKPPDIFYDRILVMPAAVKHPELEPPEVHMYHLLWFMVHGPGDTVWKPNYQSDILIAQNEDSNSSSGYGWLGTPTVTANALGDTDKDKKLRKLWTLVGVVLGPPPFALNGYTENDDWRNLSQVSYGKDKSTSITTSVSSTNITTIAVGSEVKAGLGGVSLDMSYSHAVTNSSGNTSTKETSTQYLFGPVDENWDELGTHGWAIYSAPTLVTQKYKVHSWNGTYLDQDIYYTTLGNSVLNIDYFYLDVEPDDHKELFKGIPKYPNSTDIVGWSNTTSWGAANPKYEQIFGDSAKSQVGKLKMGIATTQTYTQSTTQMKSNSNTNSFSISAGASVGLEGFSASLTVTHESDFTTSTELDSTITDSVSCSLNMPISKNGYTSLTIQPYWLQALTSDAPWIPTGYSGNLPWCITWDVDNYTNPDVATAGVAPSPNWAWGSIRNGAEKNECMYLLVGGALSWSDPDGTDTPISMTAAEFDPALGAEVALSGYPFKADGSTGDWTRYGDIWEYQTGDGATDSFELELDFARKEWSFYGSTPVPDGNVLLGHGYLDVRLNLQGNRFFKNQLKHRVNTRWCQQVAEAEWKSFGVHWIEGDYDSATGVGHLTLAGHILEDVPMGDMQVLINGVPVSYPLLRTEGFLDKVERNETVTLEGEGVTLEIDFGAGRWTSYIGEAAFQGGMVPREGATRVQVLVGGESISDQRLPVYEHTTALSYGD